MLKAGLKKKGDDNNSEQIFFVCHKKVTQDVVVAQKTMAVRLWGGGKASVNPGPKAVRGPQKACC